MKKYLFVILGCYLNFSCGVEDFIDSSMRADGKITEEVELVSAEMNGQNVVFEKIDGRLIFQGDIVIDENLLTQSRGAGITPWSSKKWTDNKVYYVIDASIPSSTAIKNAIRTWQQNSNLTFFPRTNQRNYIRFVRSTTGNNSYVGMKGGEQIINLYNYSDLGTVIHEIGHALGLWHEHTRADRDRYIVVNWSNIKESKKHNFAIYDSGMDYGPFDFQSIMLYGSYISDTDFVYDPKVPVMTKLDGKPFFEYNTLSSGDRYAIQTLYTKVRIYGDASWKPVPADYDGDGKADLSVKTNDGYWLIDYAANNFGAWDEVFSGYGVSDAIPAPADYDGDGKADLSVKDGIGYWYIDYSRNGFGGWDVSLSGYGEGNYGVPVPADYDGDGKADFGMKNHLGQWGINYADNGFGSWDEMHTSYGGSDAIPVPADYDGDGKADLSVKDGIGYWYIDYSRNGFGGWDESLPGYGEGNYGVPVPADYDGDGKADFGMKNRLGQWGINYANNGFGSWDVLLSEYGGSDVIPVPADYDGDGKADLSVKNNYGEWGIDYAADGFNGWNWLSSN